MDSFIRSAINGEVIEILTNNPAGLNSKDLYDLSIFAIDRQDLSTVLADVKDAGSVIKLDDGRYILPEYVEEYGNQPPTINSRQSTAKLSPGKKETNIDKILMSLQTGPKTSEQIADATGIDIKIVWKTLSRLHNEKRIEREERPRKQGNLYSLPDAIPSNGYDPLISDVETYLLKSLRAAQDALDTYLVSVADEDIVMSLRSYRDNARSTLEVWRKTHAA